ncbi:gametocyte-specific factor 1 [Sinocyclocheilus grahami]|uniref:gametocyte-specific factor 1 n=1 Tax=Sinocyclocheilus grahami TaxID=75366 RepID=UPI0007ACC50A|nr:PREDICTED: gametocyte-specific factor 1-like [Sinocyclocheilus grahami]XP_016119216.1 PREDICTED: gametocyte-specific factor 1-like [Sinocyclocheilus grahami]XP_016119217.1 PREDICTED: gametocyte-specific factor 1-like [Sinocyclocheilus grahami]
MPKKGSDTKPVITAPRWEEVQDFCNPDKLLLCPYDPHHLIRACRFPYHLIKCRKNHPELVGELWTCPFNARHLMRKHELSHHISTCVDRCSVNDSCVASDKTDSKFQIPVSTWTAPVCDEDWDEEVDKHVTSAPSFVWDVSKSLPQDRENPSTSSNVIAGLRAPRVLPWMSSSTDF